MEAGDVAVVPFFFRKTPVLTLALSRLRNGWYFPPDSAPGNLRIRHLLPTSVR